MLAETEELLASLPEVSAGPREDEMLTAELKEEQPVSIPQPELSSAQPELPSVPGEISHVTSYVECGHAKSSHVTVFK